MANDGPVMIQVSGRDFVYRHHKFGVPKNLYIIATMNTADRSIALLDVALRRRFGFIEMNPDFDVLIEEHVEINKEQLSKNGVYDLLNKSIVAVKKINEKICDDKSIGRDKQIGHSFLFKVFSIGDLTLVWRHEIFPLLEEYCYEDYAMLERILGSSLVDRDNLSIRSDILENGKEEDIIAALLAPNPNISASFQAVDAEPDVIEEDEPDEDENDNKK